MGGSAFGGNEMNYNYNDCLSYIKRKLRINLYPYQKEMLKAFCEGKEVRTARGIGRTYVADAFGRYVASLYDKNNFNKEPDVVLGYKCAVRSNLMPQEFFDKQRMILSPEAFARDFLCNRSGDIGGT